MLGQPVWYPLIKYWTMIYIIEKKPNKENKQPIYIDIFNSLSVCDVKPYNAKVINLFIE